MQIRELMTPNPACCPPDTPLQEIARKMEENDCGLIPVVESYTNKKPIGTVTDRDIAIRAVARGGNASNLKAADIMTTGIATVRPEMSIEECFDVMEDKEIRRVLVTDEGGKLCGIVAQADIVQADANPMRTNKVIREISESAPSSHHSGFMGSFGSSGFSSFFSGQNLYPFFVGLGSGVGLAYLMAGWNSDNDREYTEGSRNRYSFNNDFVDAANRESFGKYADAEQEIANRRNNIEDRVHTLRTEPDSQITDRSDFTTGPEDGGTTNRSRTANQGR